MISRARNQFITTVYEDSDRSRGINGSRRIVLMNEAEIATRDLKAGQVIDLTSYIEKLLRR